MGDRLLIKGGRVVDPGLGVDAAWQAASGARGILPEWRPVSA